jgi:hypothetical protein
LRSCFFFLDRLIYIQYLALNIVLFSDMVTGSNNDRIRCLMVEASEKTYLAHQSRDCWWPGGGQPVGLASATVDLLDPANAVEEKALVPLTSLITATPVWAAAARSVPSMASRPRVERGSVELKAALMIAGERTVVIFKPMLSPASAPNIWITVFAARLKVATE